MCVIDNTYNYIFILIHTHNSKHSHTDTHAHAQVCTPHLIHRTEFRDEHAATHTLHFFYLNEVSPLCINIIVL